MAAKDGRAEAPKKRKAESDDEALAHDALEAAYDLAAAERSGPRRRKGEEGELSGRRRRRTTRERHDKHVERARIERSSKNDDRLEADDGSRAEKIAAFIAEHQIDVPEGAPAPFERKPSPRRRSEAAHAGSAQAGVRVALPDPGAGVAHRAEQAARPARSQRCSTSSVAAPQPRPPRIATVGMSRPTACATESSGAEMMVDGRFRPAAVTPSATLAPTRELK